MYFPQFFNIDLEGSQDNDNITFKFSDIILFFNIFTNIFTQDDLSSNKTAVFHYCPAQF